MTLSKLLRVPRLLLPRGFRIIPLTFRLHFTIIRSYNFRLNLEATYVPLCHWFPQAHTCFHRWAREMNSILVPLKIQLKWHPCLLIRDSMRRFAILYHNKITSEFWFTQRLIEQIFEHVQRRLHQYRAAWALPCFHRWTGVQTRHE